MKARKLLLVIATIALLGTAVCAKDYKDVPDTHWAREQIAYLSDEIAGYPDGTFRPESTVTRAEFVTLLARTVFPEELKNETGDTWWKAAYRVCEANNLLSGSAGYNDAMPRGEIAQMLGYLCSDWGGVNARADAAEQFTINWNEQRMELPEPKPKELDAERLRACANQGLMMGYPDGTFKPKNGVTRAETAAILSSLKAQLALRKEGYDYVCTIGSNWLVSDKDAKVRNKTVPGQSADRRESAVSTGTCRRLQMAFVPLPALTGGISGAKQDFTSAAATQSI